MIVNGAVPHPEIDSAAAEGGSFLSTLRDLPYVLQTKWETRRFLPSHSLQPDMVGRISLVSIGVAYSTYLQMRHGIETGHAAPDYVLAGNTTRLDPSPDSSGDQGGGGPWLFPDTESTHKASAVPEGNPAPTKTTHATPSPITPTSVEPTHTEVPSTAPSPKASPSGYDNYPYGEQPEDKRMIDQTTDTNFMEAATLTCLGGTAVMGLGLLALYRLGKRMQPAEEHDSYSILRHPDES